MKNSERALLFVKYVDAVKKNDYVINVKKFANDNNISIKELYLDVMIGYSFAEKIYLDYANNFLTLAKFADYYGYSEDEAGLLIDVISTSVNRDF